VVYALARSLVKTTNPPTPVAEKAEDVVTP
jgi:hypothetical protein